MPLRPSVSLCALAVLVLTLPAVSRAERVALLDFSGDATGKVRQQLADSLAKLSGVVLVPHDELTPPPPNRLAPTTVIGWVGDELNLTILGPDGQQIWEKRLPLSGGRLSPRHARALASAIRVAARSSEKALKQGAGGSGPAQATADFDVSSPVLVAPATQSVPKPTPPPSGSAPAAVQPAPMIQPALSLQPSPPVPATPTVQPARSLQPASPVQATLTVQPAASLQPAPPVQATPTVQPVRSVQSAPPVQATPSVWTTPTPQEELQRQAGMRRWEELKRDAEARRQEEVEARVRAERRREAQRRAEAERLTQVLRAAEAQRDEELMDRGRSGWLAAWPSAHYAPREAPIMEESLSRLPRSPETRQRVVAQASGEPPQRRTPPSPTGHKPPKRTVVMRPAPIAPIFEFRAGGTATWRAYCARPGVQRCAAYDALPVDQRPSGPVADDTGRPAYFGFATAAALLPIGFSPTLLRGLGLEGGYARAATQWQGSWAVEQSWYVMGVWRLYYGWSDVGPFGGFFGVRAGYVSRGFQVQEPAGSFLPSTTRQLWGIGLEGQLPFVRWVKLDVVGTWYFHPEVVTSDAARLGPVEGSRGLSAEVGLSGEIVGPLGYRVRAIWTMFDERYGAAGSDWSQGGAAHEWYVTAFAGLTLTL